MRTALPEYAVHMLRTSTKFETVKEQQQEREKMEEVVVSLCNRSISFYRSATTERSTLPSPAGAAGSTAEKDDSRPPSIPRSRWVFPEEELPVLQWRRPRRCGVGLGNPHALCFMNAVLQALAYTPGMADDLLEGRHSSRCQLAAAAKAARQRVRALRQKNNTNETSSSSSRNTRGVDVSFNVKLSGPEGNVSTQKRFEVSSRSLRDRRNNINVSKEGHTGSHETSPTEEDSSFSFCLLCKLEEQVQSIHRACPLKNGGALAAMQQQHDGVAEGQHRGYVKNRFSRYVKQFVWRRYREGRQEDAHEFLRYLLDALMRSTCSNSSTNNKRTSGADPLRVPAEVGLTTYFGQLFGGWLQSSVSCSSCGYCSRRFDACFDMPLDINPSAVASCTSSSSVSAPELCEGGAAAASAKRHCSVSSNERGEGCASSSHKRKIFAAGAPRGNICGGGGQGGRSIRGNSCPPAVFTQAVLAGGRIRVGESRRRQQALREKGSSVEKALQQFVAKEFLTGDNSYSCPQCKQKRPATKQLRVYTPPRVLVLPIKRFAVGCWGGAARSAGCYSAFSSPHPFFLKNQAPVAFPAVLNLAPYMVSPPPEAPPTSPLPVKCSFLEGTAAAAAGVSVAAACPLGGTMVPAGQGRSSQAQQLLVQQASSRRAEEFRAGLEQDTNEASSMGGTAGGLSPVSSTSTSNASTRASSSPSLSPSRPDVYLQPPPQPSLHTTGASSCAGCSTVGDNSAARATGRKFCAAPLQSLPAQLRTAAAGAGEGEGGGAEAAAKEEKELCGDSVAVCEDTVPADRRKLDGPPLYQLYAVVTHSGTSLSSGHYRCFVRAPASAPAAAAASAAKSNEEAAAVVSAAAASSSSSSMWLLIDDEVVQTVSETFVLQRLQHDAYLLFYFRIPSAQQQQQELQLRLEKEQEFSSSRTEYAREQQYQQQQQQQLQKENVGRSGRREAQLEGRWETAGTQSDESASRSNSSSRRTTESCTRDSDSVASRDSCSSESSSSSRSSWGSRSSDKRQHAKRRRAVLSKKIAGRSRRRWQLKARGKMLLSLMQLQRKQQADSTGLFYGTRCRRQRLLAMQLSLLRQRVGQRRQGEERATTLEEEAEGKQCKPRHFEEQQQHQGDEESTAATAGGVSVQHSDNRNTRTHRQQPGEKAGGLEREFRSDSVTRGFRPLSAEEMRRRMKAASSFASQYGVAHPSAWSSDEEEEEDAEQGERKREKHIGNNVVIAADANVIEQAERGGYAFTRLQELQQPRTERRSRHDREYDRGKVKKVRKVMPMRLAAVGVPVVVEDKSGDGKKETLIVHQRAAFDTVVAQQKSKGTNGGVSGRREFSRRRQPQRARRGNNAGTQQDRRRREGKHFHGRATTVRRRQIEKQSFSSS